MATILPDLSNKSQDELIAIIEALASSKQSKLTIKRTEKGAVAVYGLGRWPLTLYRSQWDRLFPEIDAVKSFIRANATILTAKPEA